MDRFFKLHSERKHLKKLSLVVTASLLLMLAAAAHAQQMDFAFGISTISSPAYNSTASASYPPQSLTGGIYPSLSGDFLLRKHIGVMGEISWKRFPGTLRRLSTVSPDLLGFQRSLLAGLESTCRGGSVGRGWCGEHPFLRELLQLQLFQWLYELPDQHAFHGTVRSRSEAVCEGRSVRSPRSPFLSGEE